jgi:bifunctional non-homologous end joining protein LigD
VHIRNDTVLRVAERDVPLTNLNRVLWPRANFTKGDLVAYYAGVAPVLLPHLRDRAVTTVRAPEGIDGRVWFQTNAHHPPPWLRTARIAARSDAPAYEYAVIDDDAGLMWAVNLSSIEFHPFLFRLSDPEHPDHLVLDLDPGEGAGRAACCRVALLLRDRLVELAFDPYIKTSGLAGMHVLAPAVGLDFDSAKTLARDLASDLAQSHPNLAVAHSDKQARIGRVFIDWVQNDRMRQTIAPYSLRASEFPFVSTPVSWDEVAAGAEGRADLRFGPGDVLARLETNHPASSRWYPVR